MHTPQEGRHRKEEKPASGKAGRPGRRDTARPEASQVRRWGFRARRRSQDDAKGQDALSAASAASEAGVAAAAAVDTQQAAYMAPAASVARARAVDFDRFRPSRLSQIEGRHGHRRTVTSLLGRRVEAQSSADGKDAQPRSKSKLARMGDRALLALEIFGALIVAWLAFQYVYTVFIDTGPHRVSLSLPAPATATPVNKIGGTSLVTATSTSRNLSPTATTTRIVEVLPPLTGGSDDESGAGGPRSRRTATATPTSTPTSTSTATATIEPQLLLPGRLRIPVMFLDSPVHEVFVNMGQWQVSPMDIGHHEGTANPGEVGNVVLAGHRDINSALFRELDRLKPGDAVFVSNSLREYKYIVKESFVVSPDHTEVMAPTGDKRLTLITCTPIGLATQRLIVTAMLDEPEAGGR